MKDRQQKMEELVRLIEKHTSQDGAFHTSIDNLVLLRDSKVHRPKPFVYEPGIVIGAQGKKQVYLEGKRYDYNAGNFLTLFVPMPVECEILEASPEKPLLVAGIFFDRNRIANLLLKMDMVEHPPVKPDVIKPSAIFSGPMKDNLLDAVIRLLKTLSSPSEAAILGEAIIDEIYFRILSDEQGGALKYHLQQRGEIQQISKAVEYVHQNLDKPVSVDDLADIVNMSSSGFHKKFKEVMHLSPLQYAKSIKLNKAQTYIMDGKSVSEAGYMVGYNSPAQFSREYKRHFGVVPSAT
jgi:AraC-like DNA-binding protein